LGKLWKNVICVATWLTKWANFDMKTTCLQTQDNATAQILLNIHSFELCSETEKFDEREREREREAFLNKYMPMKL
jgi:aryl-phospho-beta-D-glucosidase BglC (GH1 family)